MNRFDDFKNWPLFFIHPAQHHWKLERICGQQLGQVSAHQVSSNFDRKKTPSENPRQFRIAPLILTSFCSDSFLRCALPLEAPECRKMVSLSGCVKTPNKIFLGFLLQILEGVPVAAGWPDFPSFPQNRVAPLT